MAIELKEAIDTIESGDWFAIRFITADVLKGSGGKVIELAKARVARNRRKTQNSKPKTQNLGVSRNPNHNLHFTRNLELPNKQIRKVHPPLITHINNLSVL
jgi:hypothetical protein